MYIEYIGYDINLVKEICFYVKEFAERRDINSKHLVLRIQDYLTALGIAYTRLPRVG